MFKQLEIFMIAMMFVLVTAITLIVYTIQRGEEFKTHQDTLQKASVRGAGYAIKLQLANKQRHVRLFLEEYERLATHLVTFPNDLKTTNDIKTRLQQRFSDFFTFTVTNQDGVPLLQDFDSLVGEACKRDLKKYFTLVSKREMAVNEVFVHPQPYHYHYDIMASLPENSGKAHIFFVSFDLRGITDILRTHEIPGQRLLLVKHSDPTLIEVAKQGARDKLTSGEPRLTKKQQQSIRVYEYIPDTNWRLVTLPDTQFEKRHLSSLWKEAAIIISIVSLALLLLVFITSKYYRKESQELITDPKEGI
jgi:hypothetical protein